MTAAPYLLSPASVREAINSGSVSVLDATWFMPNSPRKPLQEFKSKHIPGAHYLDLDKVASPNKFGLKHMMPSARTFAAACGLFFYAVRSSSTLNHSEGRNIWYPPRLPCGNVSSSPAEQMAQKETTIT